MFLPMTPDELRGRGWDAPDILLVTGDAYVDHPSFGAAVIGRVLEAAGFRVAVVAQPRGDADWRRPGTPRLGVFVTGGNIDSMVAHYTVAGRKRGEDYYSPGGKAGLRPDRASLVYARRAKALYPGLPVVLGGLEASLRRFAHYDYWDDGVRPSLLVESGADLLVYGMGERASVEAARRLAAGEELAGIRGTCAAVPVRAYTPRPCVECPPYEQVSGGDEDSRQRYARAFRLQMDEQDALRGRTVIQRHGSGEGGVILVQEPPAPPLSTEELDAVYALPYERAWHPLYDGAGGVPALEEVRFSLAHNRGCFGGCHFCALTFHQGKQIAARSEASLVREATLLTRLPDFKGYIHDVGGPTANFRRSACDKADTAGACKNRDCLAPAPCPNLRVEHEDYLRILRRLRGLPGVKRVFVRSGIRFDYLFADPDESFFRELVAHHVSGQLKVAPEHCADGVLRQMGKPDIGVYKRFQKRFYELTKSMGKEQYLVPYLMSSHPGSGLREAVELALFLKKEGLRPEQVQDFYPTPGTLSTCMFYTGVDPYSMKPVYVPRRAAEKAEQRALLQYFRPENRERVRAALIKAGRRDLIGSGGSCLVPDAPDKPGRPGKPAGKSGRPAGKGQQKRRR